MARGLFITFTEKQLLDLRDKAIADLLAGTVVTTWSDSGTSVGRTITGNADMILEECNDTLRQRWPETYGAKLRHLSADISNIYPPPC